MKIQYKSSVYTPAGWRSVVIEASATQVSPGFATIDKVISIDGETPQHSMSRTGANRQRYSGISVAAREVGSRKRLSACSLL